MCCSIVLMCYNGLAMHRDFLRLIINNIDMKKQILKIIENRMKNISDSDVISHNCYAGLYNEIEALDEVKNNGVLAVVSGSAYTERDMEDAFNAGIDKGMDDIDEPTVNAIGCWSSRMFEEWFNQHYR